MESTYNWYWLVDGLGAAGYGGHLANTTAIEQYKGLCQNPPQPGVAAGITSRGGLLDAPAKEGGRTRGRADAAARPPP